MNVSGGYFCETPLSQFFPVPHTLLSNLLMLWIDGYLSVTGKLLWVAILVAATVATLSSTRRSKMTSWINGLATHVRSLWFRRVPLLFMGILTTWALVAWLALPSLLKNSLLLDSEFGFLILAAMSGFSAIVVVGLDRLVYFRSLNRFHHSFHAAPPSPVKLPTMMHLGWPWHRWLLACVIAIPTPAVCLVVSIEEEALGVGAGWVTILRAIGYSLLGLTVAYLIFWLLGLIAGFVRPFTLTHDAIFPLPHWEKATAQEHFDSRDGTWLGGYCRDADVRWDRIWPGHVVAFAVFFMSTIGFIAFAIVSPSVLVGYASVPVCVILILLTVLTSFAAASFFLDFFRIPLLMFALLWVVLIRGLLGTEATFTVRNFNAEASTTPKSPALTREAEPVSDSPLVKMAKARMNSKDRNKRKSKTLIIVTAPGGGIHAAAWTARVLTGLSEEFDEFSESLLLISSVSGGSVGTMHYLNHLASPDSISLDSVNTATRASSLETIGLSLAFRDHPASVVPFNVGWDRGRELERRWKGLLPSENQSLTLQQLSNRTNSGKLPGVVFNATDVKSGCRVMFSTAPVPTRGTVGSSHFSPINFSGWNEEDLDVELVTAARMSATFPFVTPIARPAIDGQPNFFDLHLADGGYADNEGLVTAIDYIENLLEHKEEWGTAFERILLIRIQPTPLGTSSDELGQDKTVLERFLASSRWVTGPGEAMLSVRTSSQSERSAIEVALAQLVELETLPGNTGTSNSSGTKGRRSESRKRTVSDAQPHDDGETWSFKQSSPREKDSTAAAGPKMKSGFSGNNDDPLGVIRRQQKQFQQKAWSMNSTTGPIQGEPPPTESETEEVKEAAKAVAGSRLVVVEIGFPHPEPDRLIPLNWKLSPREQKWYDTGWENLRSTDTATMQVLRECLK